MAAVQPDFLVSAGYKWLLCPYGVGLMYVADRWRDARPLEETWLARLNAADFSALVDYSDTYMPGARRFDAGEKCTALLPGAIAALEQLQAWGVSNIASALGQITDGIALRLEALGFALPPVSQRCPHLIGARLPQGLAGDFVGSLRAQHVFSGPEGIVNPGGAASARDGERHRTVLRGPGCRRQLRSRRVDGTVGGVPR